MTALLATLVFVWGAAEAVAFFVVADVAITLIAARKGLRAGLIAALWGTAGALVGGVILYFWAAADPTTVDRMLDFAPAISAPQIAFAKQGIASDWIGATLIAGFSGDPYKLYAAAAGDQGLALLPFLAVSFVARLLRFLATAFAAHALTVILRRIGRAHWATLLTLLSWIAFYAWYWGRMPG